MAGNTRCCELAGILLALGFQTFQQVVKDNNGTTAWSDKHTAAYQFLQGPSNSSIDTYYSPEVAAVSGNMTYIEYDQIKVGWMRHLLQ